MTVRVGRCKDYDRENILCFALEFIDIEPTTPREYIVGKAMEAEEIIGFSTFGLVYTHMKYVTQTSDVLFFFFEDTGEEKLEESIYNYMCFMENSNFAGSEVFLQYEPTWEY